MTRPSATTLAQRISAEGNRAWLEPASAPGYFVRKYEGSRGIRGQRIKASHAAQLLRSWEFARIHNGATVEIYDADTVAALQVAHPE